MSRFKTLLVVGTMTAVILAALSASAVFAASSRPHRKDVMNATPVTYNAGWVTGVSEDGGHKGQSIKLGDHSTDASDSASYSFPNWWNQKLTDVLKIQASFLAAPGTVNTPGSPRISLEVEDVVNGASTGVIYLDPSTCGDPEEGGWVDSDFTGARTNCTITDSVHHSYTSDGHNTAWSKLVSDPYYAGKRVYYAYLIQDATFGTGVNYVDRIKLDSAFFTNEPK
jgi:hypothetical protein